MDEQNIEAYINEVVNDISNIYNGFYVWRRLQRAEYNEIFNKNKYFWGIVLANLKSNCLLSIAMLFEDPKIGKEVISIPFLLEFVPEGPQKEGIKQEILSQRPVIDNLWKWRCKVLAHTDVSVIESGRQFFDEYPINGGEIEKILDSAQKIISMIKSAIAKRGESYCFDIIKDEAEKDAARVIEELGYFFTEEKKHRERYVKGEIDDIKFPPPS